MPLNLCSFLFGRRSVAVDIMLLQVFSKHRANIVSSSLMSSNFALNGTGFPRVNILCDVLLGWLREARAGLGGWGVGKDFYFYNEMLLKWNLRKNFSETGS